MGKGHDILNMNGGGCRKKSNDFVGGTINLLERLGNGGTGIIPRIKFML